MRTLWTIAFLYTIWQLLLTVCWGATVSELVGMQIIHSDENQFVLPSQRKDGHLGNSRNIPPTTSVRKSVTSLPGTWQSLRRTLRESDTIGHKFDMVTDVTFREISQELSRRFWDTQFCNYPNKELTNTPAYKYCLRCSCDDTCDRNISCCADIQSMTDTSYRHIRDNYTVCKNFENIQGSLKYEIVVKCPLTDTIEEEQEANNRLKCEGHYNETTLDEWEQIPVFDNAVNKNYMNIYCALCHGAHKENLIFWGLDLRCKEQQTVLNGSCTKYYLPSNAIAESTVCYADDDIITRCNVTGLWEEYDAFTAVACQHLRMLYREHQKKYQNVFCAICNGAYIRTSLQSCPKVFDEFTSGLSILFMYSIPAAISMDSPTYCPQKMKYDPLLGECNTVDCSWPLLLDAETKCGGSAYVSDALYTIPIAVNVSGPITLADAIAMVQLIVTDVREAGKPNMEINAFQWFYKTSIDYSRSSSVLLDTNTLRYVNITDVYVILTSLVSSRGTQQSVDVKAHYQSFKRALGNRTTLSVQPTSKRTIVYTNITTDPWFLRASDNALKIKMSASSIQPIRDVYDGSLILKRTLIFGHGLNKPLEQFRETYGMSFLSCPAFTYKLTDHGLVRYPGGLLVKTANVKFRFDEFKSVDDSHVKICVDSVTEKMSRNTAIAYGFRAPFNKIILSVVVGLCLNL